ncbi:MAG: peptide deformylase [Clostridia bacterium]|nr:peptide deformylase [Clostridia bacterium]MBR5447546.1 peptide deformylase [Clostridia bacterium]MBR5632658.1 peptide deformylase [Clostridia bacterium]
MALLNIIKKGDDTLRKVCRPVEKITPRILTLLDDMRDTLIDSEGVGLAAPQIGILRRIALVIDTNDNDKMYELINPEIIEREGEQEEMEGCLSVPGEWAVTHRPMKVTVRAMDRDGNTFTVSGEGLTARCFCHEIDHLDGKLFIDEAVHVLTKEEIKELFDEE